MRYDFDRVIERRGTNSAKWDETEALFGSADVLPMWVADMDFPVARPITEALERRIQHEVWGYTRPGESLLEAIVDRIRRKYGWHVDPEWIQFTPGAVSALHASIRAFTRPGDEVVIQGPVYYPFWAAIRNSGCAVANNPLKLVDGRYEMDCEDLAQTFGPRQMLTATPSRARMMILCSPHNPVGRVWTREELMRAGEIVIANDGIVVSDEVHCELLFDGAIHTPFAAISGEFERHSVVCMSATKSFNLAGLAASAVIIPDPKLRNAFTVARTGILPRPSALAFSALEAAFRHGDEWLEQLLEYLQGNLDFTASYLAGRVPRVRLVRPEGTYLVWLDCRDLGMEPMELRRFMREQAKVGLDDGYLFGPSGAGFQRMNIACPRATLEEGLRRIEAAVNRL
jgi:cystathionine beta-lyase